MWVDHILPEHLLKTPEKLRDVLKEYGLDSNFDIQDYCNWIPVHWRCNLDKGGKIYDRGAVWHYINIAKAKVAVAQKEEQKIILELKKGKLLGSVEIALSEGLLSRESLIAILKLETPKTKVEPIVITFGLNYYDLWHDELRPKWLAKYQPSDYALVCDLLEQGLVKQLKSLLTCDFFYPEASGRDRETLSVRLAFVYLDENEIRQFHSNYWEILEVANYSEIYGETVDEQST